MGTDAAVTGRSFHWLKAQAFSNATEDEGRVAQALKNIAGRPPGSRVRARGHFKNPIIVLEADISKRADTEAFFKGLGGSVIGRILEELPVRMDENGVLSLRFLKQEAYMGRPVLVRRGGDVILVRGKVKHHAGGTEERIERIGGFLRRFL